MIRFLKAAGTGFMARAIAAQLRYPTGLGGLLVARLMNRGNALMNRRAVELLEVTPQHTVLDIGFGGGVSFPALLAAAAEGRVEGLEMSSDMIARATRRYAREIEAGRLRLAPGRVEAMPYAARSFDRVVTVNTIYFWADPARALAEIRRILRPDGRLVLAYRPAEVLRKLPMTAYGFAIREDGEIRDLVAAAGLTLLSADSRSDDGLGYTCLVAGPAYGWAAPT